MFQQALTLRPFRSLIVAEANLSQIDTLQVSAIDSSGKAKSRGLDVCHTDNFCVPLVAIVTSETKSIDQVFKPDFCASQAPGQRQTKPDPIRWTNAASARK